MPLTPFHLGPALLVALLAYRRLDLPTLLVGSAIIDVRALLVIIGFAGGPVHGILTTFPGATAVAAVTAGVAALIRPRLGPLLAAARLEQDYSPGRILAGALAGTWSHVALDAILYGDVRPFAPLDGNPFLNLLPPPTVYALCVVCGIAGLALYALRLTTPERFEELTV